ncbi:MAG TPA: protein lplB [Firmicutes bacterium]|jgi:putative aldouronate transport system permease protein|nr:protein lplB [Bacillota bacterium]
MKRINFHRQLPLHLMLLPAIVITLIYCYGPMFGMVMAFQNFDPAAGFLRSSWVGLANFKYLFALTDLRQVIWNTVCIAVMKILLEIGISVLLALLLNEVKNRFFKRIVQTISYFPYFLSWIILGAILREILSYDGFINKALGYLGMHPLMFLGDNHIFQLVLVFSYLWQEVGFGMIVYLAAITWVNPHLYEAAVMDGAGKWAQIFHITLPGICSMIVMMATLSLANVLDAGFNQIYALYSPVVYKSGDIIDTWVYRMGILNTQYSLATAVDLFKSAVSCILISSAYFLSKKFSDYRIF